MQIDTGAKRFCSGCGKLSQTLNEKYDCPVCEATGNGYEKRARIIDHLKNRKKSNAVGEQNGR